MIFLFSSCAPVMNDVTTDLVNPPSFTHAKTLKANQGRDMKYPPAFIEKMRKSYPDIQPLILPMPLSKAWPLALRVAREMPRWEITWTDEANHTFEGVATTALLHFKDDFVVRIREAREDPNASRVDMRSKSRVGKGDLGTNAKRIRNYFEKLETEKP